jgi:hypothetical protein
VVCPLAYLSIVPPTPTCEACGAVAADHGPVIDMVPAPRRAREATTSNSIERIWRHEGDLLGATFYEVQVW